MAIIAWKECYATGISAFDAEHQDLVARVNHLYEAIRNKDTEKQLPEIIESLIVYTEAHFKNEEDILTEHDFPELKAHKKEHADLRKKVAAFKVKLDKGDPQLPLNLFNFLREWLLHHIVEVDCGYGDFLREKGVS